MLRYPGGVGQSAIFGCVPCHLRAGSTMSAQFTSKRYLDDVVGKQLDRIVAGFKKASAFAHVAPDTFSAWPSQVHLFVPVRDALGSQRRATREAGAAGGCGRFVGRGLGESNCGVFPMRGLLASQRRGFCSWVPAAHRGPTALDHAFKVQDFFDATALKEWPTVDLLCFSAHCYSITGICTKPGLPSKQKNKRSLPGKDRHLEQPVLHWEVGHRAHIDACLCDSQVSAPGK